MITLAYQHNLGIVDVLIQLWIVDGISRMCESNLIFHDGSLF